MTGMKSLAIVTAIASLALMGLMFLPASVLAGGNDRDRWDDWDHHQPKSVTYSSPTDFTTDFWMEKLQGGGPGQQGNVLFAAGKGFIFQNAVLDKVEHTTDSTTGVTTYTTTYIGGELLLNSDGPWLKHSKLIATDITATNASSFPAPGELKFSLTFSGIFDNDPDLCFSAIATYDGTPTVGQIAGIPVFQKDSVFTASITLKHCGW